MTIGAQSLSGTKPRRRAALRPFVFFVNGRFSIMIACCFASGDPLALAMPERPEVEFLSRKTFMEKMSAIHYVRIARWQTASRLLRARAHGQLHAGRARALPHA